MKTLTIIATLTISAAAYAVDSAELSKSFCSQIPNSRSINVKLQHNRPMVGKFSLFFFTAEQFDPSKPSILFADGGPGSVRVKPYEFHRRTLRNYNVIYFHIRGAGCSQIPKEERFDKYLNSFEVAEDIESIRKSLKIRKWKAIYGASYGTTVARIYAQVYPQSTQMLILDGPTAKISPIGVDPTSIFKKGLDRIVTLDRLTTLGSMSDQEIDSAKDKILESTQDNYTNTGISNPMTVFSTKILANDSQDGKYEFGEIFVSQEFLYGLTLLSSWGINDPEHRKIIAQLLFGEFFPNIKTLFMTDAHIAWLKSSYQGLFPALDKNMIDTKTEVLKSERTLNSVSFYDLGLDDSSLCSAVPIYAVTGELDLYTPVALAKEKLANRDCYRGEVKYLVVSGAGHSVFIADPEGDRLLFEALHLIEDPVAN